MKLQYRAVTKEGKPVTGDFEAKSPTDAAVYLRSKGLQPITITPQKKAWMVSFPLFQGVRHSSVVFFTRQLSSMISSGLTLVQSLLILRDQIKSPEMSAVVQGIISDVEEGKSFSQAIGKYPQVFSDIYCSLIRASEASGILDKVLARLADNLEKQEQLQSTIKGALLYPAIVIIGMLALVVIMMLFVIPQISVLYVSLNVELPLPTRIIIALSNFFVAFWYLIFGFMVAALIVFRWWRATEAGERITDGLLLRLPIFGKLIRETILAQFTRTFGLMVGTGTLIMEALDKTADTSGNALYRTAINNLSTLVEKGVSVGDAMSAEPLFPPIVVQMARVGEETGKLDESLIRVSEYYEREVDQAVKNITTAMEPLIIVMLGIGVGFMVISVLLPIYGLISSFQ